MDEYWVIDIMSNQFAVSEEQMPKGLLPGDDVLVLDPNQMMWLKDMDGSPVGFRLGALSAIWWSTPAIREHNRAMARESEGPSWEQ